VQFASALRRRAWGARDGELAARSPAAEVHWRDYTKHEHLLAHSLGTHTMVGAATGSPAARAVLTYDDLPWFQSGGETTREVGCSRQRQGMENGAGSEALTGEGCRGRPSRGVVAAQSSFWCSCARKKGEGGKGCCGRSESKREAADGGAHQV
jgi:hypothetical protein